MKSIKVTIVSLLLLMAGSAFAGANCESNQQDKNFSQQSAAEKVASILKTTSTPVRTQTRGNGVN